jgi:hypothetical protein
MRHPRKIIAGLILILLVATAALPRNGQNDEKNTPETLIKAARFLEEKPLDKKAKDVRSWAVS